jgi:hypothetical protein
VVLLTALLSLQCIPSLGTSNSSDKTDAAANAGPPDSADQVIDRCVRALGGADALVKIISFQARGTFEAPEAGLTGTVIIYYKAPARGALVMKTSDGSISLARVFNGSEGWTQTVNRNTGGGGTRAMTGPEVERLKVTADFASSMLKYRDLYRSRNLRGKQKLEEREVYVIEAIDIFGDPEVMYFDVESGLLVRSDHVEVTDQGKKKAQSYFEDYRTIRDANGAKTAFTISTFYPDAPEENNIVRLTEFLANVRVDDSIFARPR